MGNNSYLYFLFLLWLCYLIISSVLLFSSGFLLTRTVQRKNSTCLSHREIPCADNSFIQLNFDNPHQCSIEDKISSFITKYHSASSVCLPSRTRVVLLIVDALRHDFSVFDSKNKNPLPYQNKLPVINNLLKEYPEYSRLYKFIADPPTTTMQRLKALTTGSLPTFIDAGSNFATSEINEDNILDQLLRHNHGVVFMGDDTWNGLYPHRFTRNFPFPSFNVWDLDTVDNGVIENLFPELDSNDWSLLVGHFLGVDHCGHRYGPNHPEMERKLREINNVIKNVISKINQTNDDIMLFVIGDHGMTSTGDHGGESTDEVTSALFVYSNQALSNFGFTTESVKQVDLVPTLCTILGVPVPFQNLGILILDSLPIVKNSAGFSNWQFSLYSLWANVQQVFEYIKEYAENEGTFDKENLKSFQQKYSILNAKIISIDNEEKFKAFAEELIKFLIDLRQLCENLWIQFDSYSMTRGLLFLFLTCFFVFVITDGIPADTLSKVFSSSYIGCVFVMLVVSTSVTIIIYYLNIVDDLLKTVLFVTGFCSQIMLALLVVQNWDVITSNWHSRSKIHNVSNLICRFVLIFNVSGLFSNSYIIEESFVLLFLLVTVVLVGSVGVTSKKTEIIKKKQNSSQFWSWSKVKFITLAILVAIFVRGSAYFWRCRQEQQWCFGSYHEVSNSKSETTKLQWTITVIFLGVYIFSTKEWLKNAGNMNGYSITVTLTKFLPTAIVVSMSGYWALRRVSSNKKPLTSLYSVNTLAWSVYGLTALGIIVCILKPLHTYVLTNKPLLDVNDIPALYRKIKNNMATKENRNEDIPVVYGMGTLYSAAFVTLGVYLTLLFALLLGDAVAPSAVIMFLTAVFILIVTSVLRIENATNIEQLFDVPNISILVWIIMAHYFFYATGHQPSFPNISWEAAFIGTTGIFSNNFIPGLLIVLNTFCSYVLMGILLPLVLITPFTILIMIPSVCEKKQEFKLEATRGEVILFERKNLMMTSMFLLASKYVLGHAIRVFASMLAATIHCRHLMVWNIFAPKLIFESIGMFVTLGSVIVGYLILVRINKKVEYLIQSLNKLS